MTEGLRDREAETETETDRETETERGGRVGEKWRAENRQTR